MGQLRDDKVPKKSRNFEKLDENVLRNSQILFDTLLSEWMNDEKNIVIIHLCLDLEKKIPNLLKNNFMPDFLTPSQNANGSFFLHLYYIFHFPSFFLLANLLL